MTEPRRYYSPIPFQKQFNIWDIIAFCIIMGFFIILARTARDMLGVYEIGHTLPISLDPVYLPGYAARTMLRILIAMFFALLFTFTIGTWAAKSKKAEFIIIPMIDILQSVPILSFLSITVVGFIALFPGSLLGPECCAIFVIFTAQAWNMVLGFYQSLRTVPPDLKEVARAYRLSSWQTFWRIDVPFSMSTLLWNSMMSMSASWFFVVLSEAISVSNQSIRLPGIGSYIQLAIDEANLTAVGYAISAMFIIIIIYDQLLFRPLIAWSEKFKYEQNASDVQARSWVLDLLTKTHFLHVLACYLGIFFNNFINFFLLKPSSHSRTWIKRLVLVPIFEKWWHWIIYSIVFLSLWVIGRFVMQMLSLQEIMDVFILGLLTAARVAILIIISSLIWVPVGIWIGLRPKFALFIQPVVQFLASFPANLFYPIVVFAIVHYDLNSEFWLTPLMILGTQWYILFNVIAGASAIPKDLIYVMDNLSVRGWNRWKHLHLPSIFPFYVTGAMTAAGGAWNASIVAEWVSWGDTTLKATGLGSYIHYATNKGDFPRIVLGTVMMCALVLIFNRIIWRPLYRLAEAKFHLE